MELAKRPVLHTSYDDESAADLRRYCEMLSADPDAVTPRHYYNKDPSLHEQEKAELRQELEDMKAQQVEKETMDEMFYNDFKKKQKEAMQKLADEERAALAYEQLYEQLG